MAELDVLDCLERVDTVYGQWYIIYKGYGCRILGDQCHFLVPVAML